MRISFYLDRLHFYKLPQFGSYFCMRIRYDGTLDDDVLEEAGVLLPRITQNYPESLKTSQNHSKPPQKHLKPPQNHLNSPQ